MQTSVLSRFPLLRSSIFLQCTNTFSKEAADSIKMANQNKLDDSVLKLIVCPLTKKKLRYDEERQLLINDELSIGYKVNNGIPNLVPTDAVKV